MLYPYTAGLLMSYIGNSLYSYDVLTLPDRARMFWKINFYFAVSLHSCLNACIWDTFVRLQPKVHFLESKLLVLTHRTTDILRHAGFHCGMVCGWSAHLLTIRSPSAKVFFMVNLGGILPLYSSYIISVPSNIGGTNKLTWIKHFLDQLLMI